MKHLRQTFSDLRARLTMRGLQETPERPTLTEAQIDYAAREYVALDGEIAVFEPAATPEEMHNDLRTFMFGLGLDNSDTNVAAVVSRVQTLLAVPAFDPSKPIQR